MQPIELKDILTYKYLSDPRYNPLLGFLVHQLREAAFRAAHLLRHGLGRVAARGEEHTVHQIQQPIHLALLHADLGVGAGELHGVGGDGDEILLDRHARAGGRSR